MVWPLTLQLRWVWPVILIPLIYLAPESPWWLVRKGRVQEARDVVQRLTSRRNINFDVHKAVALMVATTEHEREVEAQTSYWALFRGLNLNRTLICIGIYCIQVLNGNSLRGYSTYFLEQAGLPTTQAFNMTIAGFAVAIVGGFFSVRPTHHESLNLHHFFGYQTDLNEHSVGFTTSFRPTDNIQLESCINACHHDSCRCTRRCAS